MGKECGGTICQQGRKHGSRCGDNEVRRTNNIEYKKMAAALFGPTGADPAKAMYNKGVHGGDDTESDEEEEETEYMDMDPNLCRPDEKRTYGNGDMVLYRQGPRSFALGEVMEEPTETTTQVAPYAPEQSGTERPTPSRTRTCAALKTGQVVVYFWRKSDAD